MSRQFSDSGPEFSVHNDFINCKAGLLQAVPVTCILLSHGCEI